MKMIPIGTLCMIVGLPDRKWPSQTGRFVTSMFNGLTCTVVGYQESPADRRTHVVDKPERLGVYIDAIDPAYLLPIAPPGNPDVTNEPRREPEELLR